MRYILLVALLLLFKTSFPQSADSSHYSFDKAALNERFLALQGDSISWQEILKIGSGYVQVVDLWATWCKDCMVGFPALKKIQNEFQSKKVKFVFLSLDKELDRWKKGVDFYDLKGDHYFISKGWKNSKFCSSLNLDWIPRYLVLDQHGEIKLFRSIKTDDNEIRNTVAELLRE